MRQVIQYFKKVLEYISVLLLKSSFVHSSFAADDSLPRSRWPAYGIVSWRVSNLCRPSVKAAAGVLLMHFYPGKKVPH